MGLVLGVFVGAELGEGFGFEAGYEGALLVGGFVGGGEGEEGAQGVGVALEGRGAAAGELALEPGVDVGPFFGRRSGSTGDRGREDGRVWRQMGHCLMRVEYYGMIGCCRVKNSVSDRSKVKLGMSWAVESQKAKFSGIGMAENPTSIFARASVASNMRK